MTKTIGNIEERNNHRLIALVVVLAFVGVGVSVLSFETARTQHEAKIRSDFQSDVDRRVGRLEQHLAQIIERLRSVSAFYLSSSEVDAREFRDFTSGYLRQRHGISLIGWAPAEFSDDALDAPFDRDDPTAGAMLPLAFLEPGPTEAFHFGLDLAANDEISRSIAAAFRSGQIHHVPVETGLVFLSPTIDKVDWSGVVIAHVPRATLMNWIGADDWNSPFVVIEQITGRVVFGQDPSLVSDAYYETLLDVDGEMWSVRAVIDSAVAPPPAAWAFLMTGLAITFLLAFLIVTLATSADSARRLVLQRTRELENAEQESRGQAARLANQVSRTDQVIASIPSLLIGVSASGVVTEWNTAIADLLGIQPGDALGKKISELTVNGDCAEVMDALRGCLDRRETLHKDQLTFVAASGNEARVSLTFTPIFDRADLLRGCLIVGDDTTEKNSMELQLREAQRLEAVGRLAAGIAHEVNTPAQFVSDNTSFLKEAFADLLSLDDEYSKVIAGLEDRMTADEKAAISEARENADREYLVEEVPQALAQSMDGIRRIADIVRAMKEFSHPGGGSNKEQVDLNRLISNAVTVASNEWKYHANIVTELDEALPSVPCFPRELNQVVLNLIINGAHAIADRVKDTGTKGEIRITTSASENAINLRISDTGTGIPEAVRDKIFEPFFTTKEVGRGSGQGLALAYSAVVEQHNGDLSFETELGVGTTFIVSLPLEPQEVAA